MTKVNEYEVTIDTFTIFVSLEDGDPTAEMITKHLRECVETEGENGLEWEAICFGEKEF